MDPQIVLQTAGSEPEQTATTTGIIQLQRK